MITRRDVNLPFDPTTVPRDWVGGDAFGTTLLAALSLLFPEGERFFVDSVKYYRDRVTEPALAADVTGFIGQEAMHGRAHRTFNAMLVEHGLTSAPRIDARLRRFLRIVRRVLTPRSQLAVTCALEHFTALLAEGLLTDPKMRGDFDPTVRALWLWHAFEEVEHKAVAFDVYRAVGGGYVRRIAIMLLTTTVFFLAQGLAHARLMADRKILWRPWTWARGITRFWIWPGYFTRLLPRYLAYFAPGFHPADRDATELLALWSTELFGQGETRITAGAPLGGVSITSLPLSACDVQSPQST